MKLHAITIANFRSFTTEQTFRFPEEPGLYFMQGLNEAEPRLEANGSGKSTIWEALLWCLYGKTSKGLKAGDVCNWEAGKGTKVELSFSFDESTLWIITRTWGPNSWRLSHITEQISDEEIVDLTKDPANPVLADIRLEFTPFLHSILMAQGQAMFLDLKHDAQASLFSEVMGLDKWIDYSAKASKKASDQDHISRRLERELSQVQGRIDGQKDYKGSVEEWEDLRKESLAKLESKYIEALEQRKVAVKVLDSSELDEVEIRDKYRKQVESLDKFDDSDLRIKENKLIRAEIEAENKIRQANDQVKFFDDHESCPTCRQSITTKVKRDQKGIIQRFINDYQRELDRSKKDHDQLLSDLDISSAKKQELREAVELGLDDLRLAESATIRARQKLAMIDKELDSLEKEVEQTLSTINPYADMHQEAQNEGRRLRNELADIRTRLDHSNERMSLFSFWVRGFKDLRLNLIAEALTELEIEVNSCVTALGLIGWELKFQVDRETKGGSIQRGFSVQVLSPANTKVTPWEAWSGGESQRLRLATTMGLSNLIRSRTGVNLNLEVWDEPSQALSPQGVKDLLDALERRAQVEQRQIWVVDHTAHAFGGFSGGALITKNSKGSCISQH